MKNLTEHFHYNKNDLEFIEFVIWISEKLQTRAFLDKANRFVELKQLLKNEPVGDKRTNLNNELSKLRYEKT